MTENKKLSRRDAIKLLGAAAGASLLANMPSKWYTPKLAGGVLPAHAQTSCVAAYLEILSANGEFGIDLYPPPVLPDNGGGNGGAGSYLSWACQSACLGFTLFMDTATKGTARITTLNNQFDLVFNQATPFYDVMIDLASGDYAIFPDAAPGLCNWPRTPNKREKFTDNSGFWK